MSENMLHNRALTKARRSSKGFGKKPGSFNTREPKSMPNLDSSFQPSTPSNMKTPIITKLHSAAISRSVFAAALTLIFNLGVAWADETCSSPYLARIEGQEEFVYVWTLGGGRIIKKKNKLVTVDT